MKMFKYIYVIASVAVLSSCIKDVAVDDFSSSTIEFDVYVTEQTYTKANIITPSNQAQTFADFGVYAVEQTEDVDYSNKDLYLIDGQKVTYESEFEAWRYNDYANWPTNQNAVEFIAYAPFEHEGFASQINDSGELVIDYHTYPTDIDAQVDLMVADNLVQSESNSDVKLNFNHTLSALAFKFEGDEDIAINSIGFRGGCTSGVLTSSASGFEWSDRVVDGEALFGVTFEQGKNIISESEDLSTADSGDYIIMIPYDMVQSFKIEISYTTTTQTTYTASIYPKDDTAWEAGNIYTYTIEVEDDVVDESLNNIKFGVGLEITPWGAGQDEDDDNVLSSTDDPSMLDSRSEISNCYMIDSETKYDTYYIPVDERIYEFWGGYQGLTGDDLADYTLDEDDDWFMDVIWYTGDLMDFENLNTSETEYALDEESTDVTYSYTTGLMNSSESTFMTFSRLDPTSDEYQNLARNTKVTAEGCTNNYVTQNAKAIMKISIDWSAATAADALNGNIFVALKKRINGSSILLWSWHFWVTDYNPNVTPVATEIEGNYTVQKGNVHKYRDSDTQTTPIWEVGGLYYDKRMMDRNLGMHSTTRDSDSPYMGTIYYQYGRKEPFAYFGTSSTEYTYYSPGVNYSTIWYTSTSSKKTMKTAIQAPTSVYQYSANSTTYATWLSDDVASVTTCVWNDANVPSTYQYSLYSTRKSMFDPSPLGWTIPLYAAWNGFIDRNYLFDGDEDFYHESTVGVTFFDYIFFPFTGYYYYYHASSYYYSATTYLSLWSSNSYTTTQGRRLSLRYNSTSTYIYSPFYSGSYGYAYENTPMPIRCIQE